MNEEIGRIRRVDGEIILEFPKTWVMESRPVNPRMFFGPHEVVPMVSEWEQISLSDFIRSVR